VLRGKPRARVLARNSERARQFVVYGGKVKEIPLTKGMVAIVDDEDYPELSKHKWYCALCMGKSYAARQIRLKNGGQAKSYMHREILGVGKGEHVDHISADTLDDRRSNLRICTMAQNQHNRQKTRGNTTSRFKGVWRDKFGRYRAQIHCGNVKINLGSYHSEQEAAYAYNAAATSFWGDFARLNVIDDQQR
jgi:hypothetical protein